MSTRKSTSSKRASNLTKPRKDTISLTQPAASPTQDEDAGAAERAAAASKLQSKWRAVRSERHVGLIRLIYKEARFKREKSRASIDVEPQDTSENIVKTMQQVRTDVCKDLMAAVRKCTRMYKTMVFMKKEAEKMAHIRYLRQKLKMIKELNDAKVVADRNRRASDLAWSTLFDLVSVYDELDDEKLYLADRACRRVQKLWCERRIAKLRGMMKVLMALASPSDAQKEEMKSAQEEIDVCLGRLKRLNEFEEWAKSLDAEAEKESTKAAAGAVSIISGQEITVDGSGQASVSPMPGASSAHSALEVAADESVRDAGEAAAETTDDLGFADKGLDKNICTDVAEDTEGATFEGDETVRLADIFGDGHDAEHQKAGPRARFFLDHRGSAESIIEIESDNHGGHSATGLEDVVSPSHSHSSQDHLHHCTLSLDATPNRRSGGPPAHSPRSSLGHLRSDANRFQSPQADPELGLGEQPGVISGRKASGHIAHARAPIAGMRWGHSDDKVQEMDLAIGVSSRHAAPLPRNSVRHGSNSIHQHPPNSVGGFGVRRELASDTTEFMGSVIGSSTAAHTTPHSARVPRLEKIEHPSPLNSDSRELTVNSARTPGSHNQLRRHRGVAQGQLPGKLVPLPVTPTVAAAATEADHRFSIEAEGSNRPARKLLQQDQRGNLHGVAPNGVAPNRPRFNPCAITANSRPSVPHATPRLVLGGHAHGSCDEAIAGMNKAVNDGHAMQANAAPAAPPVRKKDLTTRASVGRILVDERRPPMLPPLSNGGATSSATVASSKATPSSASGKRHNSKSKGNAEALS